MLPRLRLRGGDGAALLPGQRVWKWPSGHDASPACVEVELRDAWVWDMYRPARFVPSVRVVTFRDVNIERLPEKELREL